jgi:hypothetical protein
LFTTVTTDASGALNFTLPFASVFGLRLSGQQGCPASIADCHCGSNTFVELQLNTLLIHKRDKTFAVLAHVTLNAGVFRKLCFFICLPLIPNDGSQYANATLALLRFGGFDPYLIKNSGY